ncbi:undecaprenyl-diphosphate phosphatase [Clostridium sp. YIM B02505]|uniref:Undecaprenyl-diphosphatase n=1 Tax=Clostridium yunnanense TaxID=2800325 RepID=A0ABS1EW97_9CLOT|nr:undecaprenyl-diphosphate phosphatase [Clostridium yunnanense]MBK1813625.1 undecaprenyl-diphosphate phosphatase [Clostridium yunnanense]
MALDFLFIFKAIIIAIVEGITEFIPVSSTGHMIIVGELINFKDSEFIKMFEIVIQLGAILAVVVLYWNKIWTMIKSFFKFEQKGIKFWLVIIVGTIPAVIFGLALDDIIDKYLFSYKTVAVGFIVGGILLILIENNFRKKTRRLKYSNNLNIEEITYGQAIKVGLFQCLAMWPGMSRSASTIMGGWISGLSTPLAAEFSFFLAIPAMIGASGLKLRKFDYSTITNTEVISLVLGFIVAFIVALVVIDGFIAFLKKKPMRVFAIYRIFAGVVLVALMLTKVIK